MQRRCPVRRRGIHVGLFLNQSMHGGCIIIHGGLDKPRIACRYCQPPAANATTAMMIPRGMACYDSPFNSIVS